MKTHPIREALEKAGATQAELAEFLEVDPSTLSNKLDGRRRWTQSDINQVLAFFASKKARVRYEQLFGAEREEAA